MEKQHLNLQIKDFSMLSLIGVGNYAKVVLVRKKSNGKLYAMKIVKKKKIIFEDTGSKDKTVKNHVYVQRQILTNCVHPFIIKMYSTFQHQKKLYFILEYCQGGQLFGLLKRLKRLSQESAKFYMAQVFLALEFLHQKKVIYRDLKPQNVLIDKQGYIRLIDFGISCCYFNNQNSFSPIAGTPQYLPPQIFNQGAQSKGKIQLNQSVDWWSFGSLIFQLIVGFPPFYAQSQSIHQMKEKIVNQKWPMHLINSQVLKDLINRLLQKDPNKRLGKNGSQQIKKHPWFFSTPWEKLIKKQIPPPFVPQIKSQEDIQWFDIQKQDEYKLTPPEKQSQKITGDKYMQFSLSWKSSQRSQSPIQSDASPTQITINIAQSEIGSEIQITQSSEDKFKNNQDQSRNDFELTQNFSDLFISENISNTSQKDKKN